MQIQRKSVVDISFCQVLSEMIFNTVNKCKICIRFQVLLIVIIH
mgnify:CR=1 FL=1